MSFVKVALVIKKRKLPSAFDQWKRIYCKWSQEWNEYSISSNEVQCSRSYFRGIKLDKKGQLKEIPDGNTLKDIERRKKAYIN